MFFFLPSFVVYSHNNNTRGRAHSKWMCEYRKHPRFKYVHQIQMFFEEKYDSLMLNTYMWYTITYVIRAKIKYLLDTNAILYCSSLDINLDVSKCNKRIDMSAHLYHVCICVYGCVRVLLVLRFQQGEIFASFHLFNSQKLYFYIHTCWSNNVL